LIRSNDRKVMEESRTVTFQEDLSTVDGEATFLATKGPLKDTTGNVVGMFGISRNITELKLTEEALRRSLDEKVALLNEVHHRVKNNLQIVASLLSLQASRTPNPEALDVLRDTHNRVRSMALLHEVLYRSGDLARINFAVYARDLCAQLLPAYGSAASQVKVDIRIQDVGLPLEQSVPCGLIINELVSNAVKHGFPEGRAGSVLLELVPTGEGMLTLTVSDEGVGLPDDLDRASTGSLGLRLVSRLVAQLKGSLTVESGAGRGTRFRVDIPVPNTSLNGEPR
jgi:two-component sensor histidine kinase